MVEAKKKFKAGRFVYRLFFCLCVSKVFSSIPGLRFLSRTQLPPRPAPILLLALVLLIPVQTTSAQSLISLRQYQTKATLLTNPFDLTKVTQGPVYQVNHRDFILQFFFTGQNIQGIVLKREKNLPILIRWCFFRNCDRSPYDYKAVLAQGYQRPYPEDTFQVRLPIKFDYHFQGMHFSSGMSPIPFK